MKILSNCTTLVMGGALQASLSFIIQALGDKSIDWYFAISKELSAQLSRAGVDHIGSEKFYVLPVSPAKSIKSRKKLLTYEIEIEPDAVFTFFGPAYVNFKAPHFLGFADPWVTHPNKNARAAIPTLLKRIETDIRVWYKAKWLKKADYWIVEADVAKAGIVGLISVEPDRIGVVQNSCRDEYRNISTNTMLLNEQSEIQILYISAYYVHKNFEIIPKVAKEIVIRRPALKFKFVITIPIDAPASLNIMKMAYDLDVQQHINIIGSVAVFDAIKLYEDSHMAFIPTLLETFSATYPEAMAAGLPIVASDFDFSRNVCKDAALYFDPVSPGDAADKLINVIEDSELREKMVLSGKDALSGLPRAEDKYNGYKSFMMKKLGMNEQY